jgi:hypothetical protein
MATYSVYLNYLHHRNEGDSGITIDFRNDLLRSSRSKEEAIKFARTQRNKLKNTDVIYVIEKSRTTEKSVYYISSKKEDHIY